MSYWSNKVALVTGGSAGLGLAIAEALITQGARVAIVARDSERLAAAVEKLSDGSSEVRVLGITADVTQQSDVVRMIAETIETFGRLDLLVNNAGSSMRGEVLSTPPEEFLRLFEVNFLSMVRATQAAAPHLLTSRGHVVNIGSLASKSTSRYLGAYPASKFPVAALSQQLRFELEPRGVHVLLVCPGPIKRHDAIPRYQHQTAELPASAQEPGAGAKIRGIEAGRLATMILLACQRKQAELVVPWRAKILFTVLQIWPRLGDWIIERMIRK